MNYDVLEIGLFQLENLASTPTRFLFYDLRSKPDLTSTEVDRLLAKAERIPVKQLEQTLGQLQLNKETPVILVGDQDRDTRKAGLRLAKLGYSNVCVVSGGVAGLLSELA